MGVSEIGFPQNVVYKQRIQTSDTLPVTIGASKYCEFLFDIDAGDRMTPLGIVGWSCNDKTQVFLLDFYMDTNLQTAKLILKNPYATTIAISSLYIDVLYSKQGLDMSEVDVVDNLTTDSAIAALSARQGKLLDEKIMEGRVRAYVITKQTTTGYFVVPYTEVPRGIPVVTTNYASGAANTTLIYSVTKDYQNNSYVVYVRQGDGSLPTDGTTVSLFMMVFLL